MTTINQLQIRRREILEVASAVQQFMNPEQLRIPSIANVAHVLLCDLCKMMMDHLADEKKSVYPELLTDANQNIQNMAWGLINNDRLVRPEFENYKKRWLKDCEFQFTDAFIKETQGILELLHQRMELEKNSIIPRLESRELLANA